MKNEDKVEKDEKHFYDSKCKRLVGSQFYYE